MHNRHEIFIIDMRPRASKQAQAPSFMLKWALMARQSRLLHSYLGQASKLQAQPATPKLLAF